MGAHRIEDRNATDVARLVGRGALATSAALVLTGAGTGLALASPGHGDGSSGSAASSGSHASDVSGSAMSPGDDESSNESEDARACRAGDDDMVGGLLDGLGLGLGSTDRGDSHGHPARCDSSGSGDSDGATDASSSSGSSTTSRSSGTRQVAAPNRSADPATVPPGPGQRTVVDLPG